ncbi:MAG: 1-acyl-sn-glycerol-3-phosphate acyltransferase [Elusimicrobia bacterium]|nr:1-acyl-sn-glycerol-3-phosphate acyltransferase [Elusimicrobiota bacterium]
MLKSAIIALVRLLFKVLNGLSIDGIEKIPETGRLILACNHLSNADPPAVMSEVSRVRKVYVLGKRELFKIGPVSWFLRQFRVIPLDRHREGGDIAAFRKAMEVLERDECLLVFPEGTRARGRVLPPKPGIGYLAHKTGAPVLTLRIFGSESFSKLGKITIKVGNIRSYNAAEFTDSKNPYTDFARSVMSDIFSIK